MRTIWFASNLPLSIPTTHDKNTINLFKDYIKAGIKSKDIRRKLCLSYNNFLYYWFYVDIQLEHIRHISPRKAAIKTNINYISEVNKAIEHLVSSNIPVSVENVCRQLKVCHETLRNRDLLENIQEAKSIQKEIININKNKQLLMSTEHIINEKLKKGEVILSSEIYNYIGACRTSLSRMLPQITKQIYLMIKYAKY